MALAPSSRLISVRQVLAVLLSFALAASLALVDARWTWAGFPSFTLPAAPAYDVVYVATVDGAGPGSMRIQQRDGGVELELTMTLPSGELWLWESTHEGATVEMAAGRVIPGEPYPGVLATWRSARNIDGRRTILYAWIGRTFVVIDGPQSPSELLRIANGLRPVSARSLIL